MQSGELPMGEPEELEPGGKHTIYSVFFSSNGKEVLSGGSEGLIRRRRIDDKQEVGKPISAEGAKIWAAALSPDQKWLVCGLDAPPYARVWNAEIHEKVIDIKDHRNTVFSVDVSKDSTKFATGSLDKWACIWDLSTGKRLAGMRHDGSVVAVRFSPNGDLLATADSESIRIYKGKGGSPLRVIPWLHESASSLLDWSADGRLLAAPLGGAESFEVSSERSSGEWSVPSEGAKSSEVSSAQSPTTVPSGGATSIALSRNQKFIAVATDRTLSFCDASTYEQIGPVIRRNSRIYSIALSPGDDCVAIGEENGKVTLCYPRLLELPLMDIGNVARGLWMQGDWEGVEQRLMKEVQLPLDSFHHAHALAHLSLSYFRSKRYDMSEDSARKSIWIQQSAIGRTALAMTFVGKGDYDAAIREFDLVFTRSLSAENDNDFLLLVKAVILFQCERRDDALSRVGDLIKIVDDKLAYNAVWARMSLLIGLSLLRQDCKEALEFLSHAQEDISFRKRPPHPYLDTISLIFGWSFDRLSPEIQRDLEHCVKTLETLGDDEMRSGNAEEATKLYSTVLSLNQLDRSGLLVKRSRARAMLKLWSDALLDADEAIQSEPQNPLGYQRRHAALYALQRFDEAAEAVRLMFSLAEKSRDHHVRQPGEQYVSPIFLVTAVNNAVDDVSKLCPHVLIDVRSGRLCDATERMDLFKSTPELGALLSSLTLESDDGRISQVVKKYFEYVTFSHVWEGKEPSYQDVRSVGSISKLGKSSLNDKLRSFCKVVSNDGYRWAWSDTCCIDKTISTVLYESLKMMYKWYQASAATFVYLADVDSELRIGSLKHSKWMTRAWTSQELLVPVVIRFYDRKWRLYRRDPCKNHKESPEIIKELTEAIGLARETITTFNPDDLSVREKLRLASKRNATREEDIAYSLIGIFSSDIRPDYGERDAALGHLLEEIVARSGEVSVLAWAGKSSSYNSCLPSTLAVYEKTDSLPLIDDSEMDSQVEALKSSLREKDAISIYDQITRLPSAAFTHRRLRLPSIIFQVKRLGVQGFKGTQENHYSARVPGIGYVDFYTSGRLPLNEPQQFILVHPWIRDLRDPFDGFTWGSTPDDDSVYHLETEIAGRPSSVALFPHTVSSTTMDSYTLALRLLVRLQRPFHALLLQRLSTGQFKRVAAEREIVVPGLDPNIDFAKDVLAEVVEIL